MRWLQRCRSGEELIEAGGDATWKLEGGGEHVCVCAYMCVCVCVCVGTRPGDTITEMRTRGWSSYRRGQTGRQGPDYEGLGSHIKKCGFYTKGGKNPLERFKQKSDTI